MHYAIYFYISDIYSIYAPYKSCYTYNDIGAAIILSLSLGGISNHSQLWTTP